MVYKDFIEDLVVKECKKLLMPSNINKIAREIVNISKSYNDELELNRLKDAYKVKKTEERNQTNSLRACDNEDVRNIIFEDLKIIACELKELEKQIHKEENRHNSITEKQVRVPD